MALLQQYLKNNKGRLDKLAKKSPLNDFPPHIVEIPLEQKRRPWRNLNQDEYPPQTESESVTPSSFPDSPPTITETACSEPISIPAIKTETLLKEGSIGVQKGFKEGSIGVQLGSDWGSELNPKGNKKTVWGSEPGSIGVQLGSDWGSIGVQTRLDKSQAKSALTLRGDQRKIIEFFFSLCLQSGVRTTQPVSTVDIKKINDIGHESQRTAIKRLLKGGFITRASCKSGRAGWSQYTIEESTYREMNDFAKRGSIGVQLGSDWGSTWGSQWGSTDPCSSSILLNTKTTTTEGDGGLSQKLKSELIFENWDGLSSASLVKYVYRDGSWLHSISELQDLIDRAAAAIEFSKKTKSPITNSIGFLHSCLARWSVDTPPGYRSREEKEKERKLFSFRKERDSFLEKHQLLKNTDFESIITKLCENYVSRSNIGWNKSVEGIKTEFLNELYVNTMGYNQEILDLLGGTPFKTQLGIKETVESLGLGDFIVKLEKIKGDECQ